MKKKTQEQFEHDVSIANPDITVLGTYVNNATKVKVKCEKCGRIWDAVPCKITVNYQCPICEKQEGFLIFLEGHDYIAIDAYQDQNTRIKIQCKKCGFIYNVVPKTLKRDSRCPKCCEKGKYRKWTNENLVKKLQTINPNIILLDETHGYDVKIPCKCRVCGYEFLHSPHQLLTGRGCRKCNGHRDWTAEQFDEQVAKANPNIAVRGFTQMKKSVYCKCIICGYEWSTQAYAIANGHSGCPRCHKREPLNFEQFKTDYMLSNPTIEILDTQVRTVTDMLSCHCKRCGNVWKTNVARLKSGNGCMLCRRSSTSFVEQAVLQSFRTRLGEKAVLSRNKSTIGKELDIYIPLKNIAFEPGSWYFHKHSQAKDSTKRQLCAKKNIRLITIYYNYSEPIAPFSYDCLIYSHGLGEKKYRKELKKLIDYLFEMCGIFPTITSKEWNIIQQFANEHSMRLSAEEVIRQIHKVNPDIIVLGKPTRAHEKVSCQCKKCGYIWDATSVSLRGGTGCPQCGGTKKLTQEEFEKELETIHPKVKALEKYKTITHPIFFHCFDCGYEWKKSPRAMIRQGSMCPVCWKRQKLSAVLRSRNIQICDEDVEQINMLSKENPTNHYNTNEFVWLVSKINPNIEVVGQYTIISDQIDCICKKCNNPWAPRAEHILNGHSCPFCNNFFIHSKQAKTVYKYDLMGNYIQEYKSIKVAADAHHVSKESIRNACVGKTKACAGYQWKYEKTDKIEQQAYTNTKRKVYKFNLDGDYLQEYDCARSAAEEHHVYVSSIRRACSGRAKTCAGFKWSYSKNLVLQ